MEDIDPELLEILQYQQQQVIDEPSSASKKKVSITALHLALRAGNNRSIEIILNFLSKIPYNSSKNICDVMHELVEFKNLQTYLARLPVCSLQMERKNILKIKACNSEEIIAMKESSTIYIDDMFFRQKMGEDKNNDNFHSYSVQLVGLRINWMLKKEGKAFLSQIMRSEFLDFYKIKSLKMIIEFLYQRLKFYILLIQLPLYLMSLITLISLALFNEAYR